MSPKNTGGGRPLGRRKGDPEQTRQAILSAARDVFGESGFERATIRAIATAADVDPALLIHYFDTKQNLFAVAHRFPFDPAEVLAAVVDAPLDQRGELLTRSYLTLLAGPSSPGISLLRASNTNDQAASIFRQLIANALHSHAGKLAPGPNSELRVALAVSQLVGVVVARQLIGVEALAETTLEDLIDAVSPTIQAYLDGPS